MNPLTRSRSSKSVGLIVGIIALSAIAATVLLNQEVRDEDGPPARSGLSPEMPMSGIGGSSTREVALPVHPSHLQHGESGMTSPLPTSGSLTIGGREYSVHWEGDRRLLRYPSGALYSSATFVDGKKDGIVQAWHESGRLYVSEMYHLGSRNGLCQYYSDNGILVAEGVYLDGRREGWWRTWYKNGVLESEGAYLEGKMQGFWRFQQMDGGEYSARSGTYSDGELVDE